MAASVMGPAGRTLSTVPGAPGSSGSESGEHLAVVRPLPRRPQLRRPGVGRVVPSVAVIAGLLGSLGAGFGSPSWWALPAALACLAIGLLVSTAPALARTRWANAPTDAVLAMTLALAPGAWIVPVMVVAVAGTQLGRKVPAKRASIVMTRAFGAAGLAALVTVQAARLDDNTVAAGIGMFVWWAVNHLLSVLAVARMTGRPVRPLLRTRAMTSLPGVVLGAVVGLTFGELALHAPAGLLGLAAPVLLVGSALQRDARQLAESRALTELVRTAGGGRTLDDAARLVITSAARLLGGADVELVLVGAGELVRYLGTEAGAVTRTRLTLAALDDPLISSTLSGRAVPAADGTGAARRGRENGRAVITVPLGPAGSPIAALVARRPGAGAHFSRDEALLADALATQTTSWLPQAVGGLASTTPADRPLPPTVAALHTSAVRLAGLAVPDADTDAVLDELHALEVAVAALFGADPQARDTRDTTAVASDSGLAWTTSGLLS